MLMSVKIILQFKPFEICEQQIYTKMSNLNNDIPVQTLCPFRFYTLCRAQRQKSHNGEARGTWVLTLLHPWKAERAGGNYSTFSGLRLSYIPSYTEGLLYPSSTIQPVLTLRASPDGILTQKSLEAFYPTSPLLRYKPVNSHSVVKLA